MARQTPPRRNPEPDRDDTPDRDDLTEPDRDDVTEPDRDGVTEPDRDDVAEPDGVAGDGGGSRAVPSPLWAGVRIDPVEIALPAGVGYTLRAYRGAHELTPTDIADREADPFDTRRQRPGPDEDDDDVVILDEEFIRMVEEDETETRAGERATAGRGGGDDEAPDDDEDADESDDVPIFLSHRGRLLLFKSAESLVTFIRSGAPNDLTQLPTWERFAERVRPADIAPAEDDSYELDLVVENLRGGHDAWDVDLLIDAGDIARDLAYALRLDPVIAALAPGSPLDDLDEALRRAAAGGVGSFFGRRRLRKIGAQQATLGWRTIIGKISAAVDWRD